MTSTRGYWNPYVAGFALGLVLTASFVITGNGLGASGAVGRVVAACVDVVSTARVDTNPYLAPMAGGDTNPLDSWIVWSVLGALAGGLVSGATAGRLKVETFHGPRITPQQRWMLALLGGTIMGFGARMARGCTSGQALSGGAMLSVGSWAFMFSVFIGGYALAYFVRRTWN